MANESKKIKMRKNRKKLSPLSAILIIWTDDKNLEYFMKAQKLN